MPTAPPNLAVANQWTFSDTGGYAPGPLTIANSEGNGLVAVIAVGSFNVSGQCPKLTIADNAHNWWTLAGSRTNNSPGVSRRLDVWVCENARAATTLSVTSSQIYSGIVGYVGELSNFPWLTSIDFAPSAGGNGTAASMSGTAAQYDYVLSALGLFLASPGAVTPPASLTTSLAATSTGGAGGDMSSIWLDVTASLAPIAAGAVSANWSWVNASNYGAVTLGFNATPPPPAQPNPNFPSIFTEAAFGWSPGAQTGANPTWTALSSRVTGDENSTLLKSARGREYELTAPEAGDLDVTFDNLDGSLNPTATSSPYYPNVVPEVPVRASGLWCGRRFGLGFSYANGWPQSFPNPQWGEVPYTGKDAIGIIGQGSMPSAYAGEVLADLAETYYPLGEFYESPQGSLFANQSRYNQIPMIGYSPAALGTNFQLSTGQTLGLLGDSSTGIGVTGIQTTDNGQLGGAGAFVRDNNLPNWSACTYECWTTGTPQVGVAGSGKNVRLLGAWGRPNNYLNASGNQATGERLAIYAVPAPSSGGALSFQVTLSGFLGGLIVNLNAIPAAPAPVHHVVATCSQSGSNFTVQVYIDGQLITSGSGSAAGQNTSIQVLSAGPVNPFGGLGFANNYAVGLVAAYRQVLPAARILSHYNVGIHGRQNAGGDSVTQRLSALFAWSGLGVPYGMASPDGSIELIGNADQVQGSALADALYALTVDEGGMFYAAATANGEIWYTPRQALYNLAPKAVLGDNPTDVNNNNPTFNGLTGWNLVGLSGTDAADTTAPGYHSGTFTVNASGLGQAYARFTTPVTGGATYKLTGNVNPISGNGNYGSSIDWFTSTGTFISTSSTPSTFYAPNGQWSFVPMATVTAPANAAFAHFGPTCYVPSGSLTVGTQFKAAQYWLTCTSSEIPYDPASGFDYSDTFLYNIVSSQRTASTGTQYVLGANGQAQQAKFSSLGADAIVADLTSETQYFPRGPLEQPVETTSDEDAYDRANWTLAAYKQPQLRANQVVIHCASNPGVLSTVLRLEQGDVVTVNRRPAGAPTISLTCIIQKVEVVAGPNLLDVTLTLAPYFPGNAVLQAGTSQNAVIGSNSIPW